MPKAVLEFNLPEEQSEFNLATKAPRLASAVLEMLQRIRRDWKYNDSLDEKAYEVIDQIYSDCWKIVNEEGITDEDLYS